MAKGKAIVLTVEAKGNRVEGIAAETILPGTMLAIDPAVAEVGGKPQLNADTTAGFAIADIDYLQGKTATESTAAGSRVFGYCPLPGDELNVLFVAADGAQAVGDVVGPVGTDGLFAATGTGWVIRTAITVASTPAAGTLVHVMKL